MRLEDARKLHQKKYREEFGCFLVEGEHLVLELEKAARGLAAWQSSHLYVTEAYADWPGPFRKTVVTDRQMAQLADTQSPQGILAVAPMVCPPATASTTRTVYLHEIQDPGNLGTILRTLGWFGGFRCLLSPGSVDPFNPKVVRASMGAIFHVPLERDVPPESLMTRFARIACLDMQGRSIADAGFRDFDCYVFGNEARGIPREALARWRAQPFSIAGCGDIDSLNLASALSMCIYELSRC